MGDPVSVEGSHRLGQLQGRPPGGGQRQQLVGADCAAKLDGGHARTEELGDEAAVDAVRTDGLKLVQDGDDEVAVARLCTSPGREEGEQRVPFARVSAHEVSADPDGHIARARAIRLRLHLRLRLCPCLCLSHGSRRALVALIESQPDSEIDTVTEPVEDPVPAVVKHVANRHGVVAAQPVHCRILKTEGGILDIVNLGLGHLGW